MRFIHKDLIMITGCCLMLQGCISLGLAVHDTGNLEVDLSNPLGVIQIDNNWVFCQHVSGIMKEERGYGFNMCGVWLDSMNKENK